MVVTVSHVTPTSSLQKTKRRNIQNNQMSEIYHVSIILKISEIFEIFMIQEGLIYQNINELI